MKKEKEKSVVLVIVYLCFFMFVFRENRVETETWAYQEKLGSRADLVRRGSLETKDLLDQR